MKSSWDTKSGLVLKKKDSVVLVIAEALQLEPSKADIFAEQFTKVHQRLADTEYHLKATQQTYEERFPTTSSSGALAGRLLTSRAIMALDVIINQILTPLIYQMIRGIETI